ncbi:unnamed protein product [Oncorhynchus mykiss]|uniref:LRRCT domain-containing protein n=1 Tax=Oncorhynchus mykiss TaxID=8022 RepID=A0A060YSL6_ONCMY|nr:unnamed protein product [Oncorhynchus mykiss]
MPSVNFLSVPVTHTVCFLSVQSLTLSVFSLSSHSHCLFSLCSVTHTVCFSLSSHSHCLFSLFPILPPSLSLCRNSSCIPLYQTLSTCNPPLPFSSKTSTPPTASLQLSPARGSPSWAEDACDLPSPPGSPSTPAAPITLPAEEGRPGQAAQSRQTPPQTGQVWMDSRVRGQGRQGRSGDSRHQVPECSEYSDSEDLFVDCQGRKLSSIPIALSWSRAPDHLLLARNRIRVLHDGAFSGFEGLRSLDLQQNRISVLEEGVFLGLIHLTTLLLQHNRLGTLSEEALIPMPALRYLRLHDNPWSCRCTLDSLVRTLQVPSNRNLGNHARCAEPVGLRGRKLRQVDPELLCLELEPPSDPPDPQGEDQRDSTYPLQPIPIRGKPDATTSCHTYLFPTLRLDCRSRGEVTNYQTHLVQILEVGFIYTEQ